MMNILHFIRYMPTYLKFYFTNWRYKKFGYRRFRYNLHIAKKDKNDNIIGFESQEANIVIKADYNDVEQLESIPLPEGLLKTLEASTEYRKEELPFKILRDEHADIFQACDHLTYKEII